MNPLVLTSRTGGVTKRNARATKQHFKPDGNGSSLLRGCVRGISAGKSSTGTAVGETEVVDSESNLLNHYYNL